MPPRDANGRVIRTGDVVKILGIPDLSRMSPRAPSPHWRRQSKHAHISRHWSGGEAWLLKGEPRKAVVTLAGATTLNKQVRASSLLAEAFLALGQQNEAYEIAALALQRDPANNKALAVAAATEVAYRRWASQ